MAQAPQPKPKPPIQPVPPPAAPPASAMTFDELPVVKFFKQRGWIVEELHAMDTNLVDVPAWAAVGCGDGRPVRAKSAVEERLYNDGPKFFGGTAGLASLFGVGTVDGLKAFFQKLDDLHLAPAAHGDNHKGIEGCGHQSLWQKGKLSKVPPMVFTLEEIKSEILAHKGLFVDHVGHHVESTLDINLIPGKTEVPNGMRFIEDLWLVDTLCNHHPEILQRAYTRIAETVENLSTTVRTVRIIH